MRIQGDGAGGGELGFSRVVRSGINVDTFASGRFFVTGGLCLTPVFDVPSVMAAARIEKDRNLFLATVRSFTPVALAAVLVEDRLRLGRGLFAELGAVRGRVW